MRTNISVVTVCLEPSGLGAWPPGGPAAHQLLHARLLAAADAVQVLLRDPGQRQVRRLGAAEGLHKVSCQALSLEVHLNLRAHHQTTVKRLVQSLTE